MDTLIKFELQGGEPIPGRPPFAVGTRPSPTGLQWVCSPTNQQNRAFRLNGSFLENILVTMSSITVKSSVELSASPIHVACSSHGSLVAVACADGSLRCYDGDLTERWTLEDAHSHVVADLTQTTSSSRGYGAGASGAVRSLQICGRHLLLADSKENTLKIWNATLAHPQELVGSTLRAIKVSAAAFSCVPNRDGIIPLAIGDVEGKVHLYQFTPKTGSFSRKKEPTKFPREGETKFACTHLDWFDPNYLAAGYCRVTEEEQDPDDEEDSSGHEAVMFVAKVDQHVWENSCWTDVDDVVGFFSVPRHGRHAYSTCFVPTNGSTKLLFVTCNVGTDVGVLVQESENEEWRILDLEEGCGATTPTDDDDEYTYPVGMTAVTLAGGLSLLLPSTDGRLSHFSCLNTEDNDFFDVPETKSIEELLPSVGEGGEEGDEAPELEEEDSPSAPFASGRTPSSLFGGGPASLAFGSTSLGATPSFGGTSSSSNGTPAFGETPFGSTSKPAPVFGQPSSLGSQGSPAFGHPSSLGSATTSASPFSFGASSDGKSAPTLSASSSNPFAPAPASTSAFGSGSNVPTFGSGSTVPIFGSSSASTNSFANVAKNPAFPTSTGFGTTRPISSNSPFGAFSSSHLHGQSAMAKPLFGSPTPAPMTSVNTAPETENKGVPSPAVTEKDSGVQSEDHRQRLIDLYTKFNPEKLDSVDRLLEKYKGREDVLFKKIDDKYTKSQPDIKGGISSTPSTPRPSTGRPYVAVPDFMVRSLPTEQEAMDMFDRFDEDGNKILSFGELSKVWKQLRKTLDHKITVMKAYHIADANQDGMLKRDEFEMFIRVSIYYDNCYDEFGTRPGRHAQRLSKEEFRLVAPKFGIRKKDCDWVFELMDDNNSKYVTYEEFSSWMAKNTCEWEATVESAKSPKAAADSVASSVSTPSDTPRSSSRPSGIPTPTARPSSRATSTNSSSSLGSPRGPSVNLESKLAEVEDNEIEGHRKKLKSLFEKYNPTKLDSVEQLLLKYKGRYPELYAKIDRKYKASNKDVSSRHLSLPPFATESLPSEEEAMRVFDDLDKNMNNTLSFGELGQVWARFFKNFDHKLSLMKAYNIADKNQDGMLKRDEFEVFLRVCVYYHNCFDLFGTTGRHSQRLSLEEFRVVAPKFGIHTTDLVFELMDDNNSRYVTFEEFCSWLARNTCEWPMTKKGEGHEDLAADVVKAGQGMLYSEKSEAKESNITSHTSRFAGRSDGSSVAAVSAASFSISAPAAPVSAQTNPTSSFSFGNNGSASNPNPFSFRPSTSTRTEAPPSAVAFSFGTSKTLVHSDLQVFPGLPDKKDINKAREGEEDVSTKAQTSTGYPPFSGRAPINPYSSSQVTSKGIDDVSEPRKKLTALFSKYNPSKLDSVEELLVKYKGRYPHLYDKIERKYNRQQSEEPVTEGPETRNKSEPDARGSRETESEPKAVSAADSAARAFDARDKEGTGTLPLKLLEELIDELGEGLSGEEFEAQKRVIDPSNSNTISRGAFINWYVSLLREDTDDNHTIDSEELRERAEEKMRAREAFMKLATDDWIKASRFGELFETMGTTYCEEEHAKTLELLTDSSGRIHWDSFSRWYIEWLFGDDTDVTECGASEAISAPKPDSVNKGWGDTFKSLQKGWKCNECTSRNDDKSTTCASCEAPRPGFENTVDSAKQPGPTQAAGAIGSGGFSFGSSSSPSKTNFSFGVATKASTTNPNPFMLGGATPKPKTGFSFGNTGIPVQAETAVTSGFKFGTADPAASGDPKDTVSIKATTNTESPKMSSYYPPMSTTAPKNPIATSKEKKSDQDPAHRKRLVALFKQYNPSKLDSVDSLLEKYRGREDVLYKKINDKYNKAGDASLATSATGTKPKRATDGLSKSGVKAATVFDAHDSQNAMVLPKATFEELIDELGEGFSAGELEAQLSSIDPEGKGVLSRQAFIRWYVALVESDERSDGRSVDSEEKQERQDELQRVHHVFMEVASGDSILPIEFPKLFESIGTTYCEEEHRQTLTLLTGTDGRIHWPKFSKWYIDWLFGDETEYQEEDERQEAEDAVLSGQAMGWGDAFKDAQSGWKCDQCMVRNNEELVKCASCEAPRPGLGGSTRDQPKDAGTGGFSFGGKPPKEANFGSIGTAGFSFGGKPAKEAGAGSIRTGGGFSFGGKPEAKEVGVGSSGEGSFSFGGKVAKDAVTRSAGKGGFSFGGEPAKVAGTGSASTGGFFGGKQRREEDGVSAATGGFTFGGELVKESISGTISFGRSSHSNGKKPGAISVSQAPTSNTSANRSSFGTSQTAVSGFSFSEQSSNFQFGSRSSADTSADLITKAHAEQKQDGGSFPVVKKAVPSAAVSSRPPLSGQTQLTPIPSTTAKPTQSGVFVNVASVGQSSASSSMSYPPLPGRAPVNPLSAAGNTEEYRKKLQDLFKKYNPAKLDTIEELLVKYKGREAHLFKKIENKYSGGSSTQQDASNQPTNRSVNDGSAYKERLTKLFTKYDQSKLTKVDALLKKYVGQEEELIKKLEEKYLLRSQHTNGPATERIVPRMAHVEQTAPMEKPKSQYEAQLRFGVERFKSSILSVHPSDRPEDDLKGRVEKLQKLKDSCLNSLMQLMDKINDERASAVFVGSRKADTSRLVKQANVVLETLARTDSVEQLDAASERSRRHIAAGCLRVYRSLESLKDTLRLLEGSSAEEYYSRIGQVSADNEAFFDYCRGSYDRNETFNEMANRKLNEARRTAETLPERGRLDRAGPGITRTPQGKVLLRPFRGTRKMSADAVAKPLSGLGPFAKWRSAGSSFRQLKPLNPRTLQIPLPNTKEPREEFSLKVLNKSHHQFLASQATRNQSTISTPRSAPLPPSCTSSEALPVRPAWDAPFAVDQPKIKPLSAGLTSELKQINAVDAARDALAAYGTTPEKVSKVLDTKKRGELGLANPGAQKAPGAKAAVPLSSRVTASSSDSGAQGSAGLKARTAPKITPSGYPPLPKEAPKPTIAGSSSDERKKGEEKQLPPKPLVPLKPLVTPGKLESSSFSSMKGLADASLFTPSKPAAAAAVDNQEALTAAAGPDYNKMLSDFYAKHNPGKVGEVMKNLEKYKGRESEMFARLAKKYGVANPMDSIGPSSFGGSQGKSAASSPFGTPNQGSQTTPFGASDEKLAVQPFGTAAKSVFNSAPGPNSFGSGQPSQATLGQTPFSTPKAPTTPFGAPQSQTTPLATNSAPFGNAAPAATPFGAPTPAPAPFGTQPPGAQSARLFNGKTTREMLTAFYQEKNPSKIGDVEMLLKKYAGKEENMFRNLAKKYSLNPTVFGVSAAASASSPGGFGQPSQFGGGGFGQPSPLGGGSVFGQTTPMGGVGGFGSASGFGGGASFGSLANNTGSTPFGAPGPSQGFGGGGFASAGFGSSPFGQPQNPFGAPRR